MSATKEAESEREKQLETSAAAALAGSGIGARRCGGDNGIAGQHVRVRGWGVLWVTGPLGWPSVPTRLGLAKEVSSGTGEYGKRPG